MKFVTIEEWTNKQQTVNTTKNYKSHLNRYFEFFGSQPEQYFNSERDYDKDFKDYAQHIKDMSLCTRKMRLTVIRTYLRKNKITLDDETISETIKPVIARVQTQDEVPTPEILREILQHGGTKDRSLFLFLSSSGARVGETLQLTKDDIPAFKQLDQRKQVEYPIKVRIPSAITKNHMPRTTYISKEAWHVLLEWDKERGDYIRSAARKSKYYKDHEDNRLFPHGYSCAVASWNRLVRKAKHNEKDKSNKNKKYQRRIYHIHVLRAYFKNRLLEALVQERWIEVLLGHIGYVGGAYDKSLESQIRKAYEKGESSLSIYEIQPDLTQINSDVEKMKDENQRLRNYLQDMDQELKKLLRQDDQKHKKELTH
jgi:integrase